MLELTQTKNCRWDGHDTLSNTIKICWLTPRGGETRMTATNKVHKDNREKAKQLNY